MTCKNLIFAGTMWLLATGLAGAQALVETSLPLDGHIAPVGTSVELNWFNAEPPRVGSVTVKRRLYGQTGSDSWQTIATNLGPVMKYRDYTIRPGVAYEYQVLRTARDIVDVGYWLTGVEVPVKPRQGQVYLVIEETVSQTLAPRLERFERDLIGSGWTVSRYETPPGDAALRPLENIKNALPIKNWLQEQYNKDPFGQHAVILIGHVPILRSGRAAPDGHDAVPQPSDLFYAEVDGKWSVSQKGFLLHNSLPGDFIEMQVGRIDFLHQSDRDPIVELEMLRDYFDKNHHWRMGLIGDLREAYGQSHFLYAEQYGLRNIVGPAAVAAGGHHDAGELQPWLWGVDFGDYNGRHYREKYANKAVFAINFGSGKQRIDLPYNPMIALLGQPWYTLAVGWGGRPAWWLHHMALGGSIGDVHMRTVNNGVASEPYRESMDYFPTGIYLWRNPVWINLVGDPTLRAFPLSPPSRVTTDITEQGVRLSWAPSPDPDVTGYHVYRATPEQESFTILTEGAPVSGLEFTDPTGHWNTRYMIRAYGLKDVYAGSFFSLSQGKFSSETPFLETDGALDIKIEAAAGTAVPLPNVFNQVTDGKIHALIEPPSTGQLQRKEGQWIYTPRAGFSGNVVLRFSIADSWHTAEGRLTIRITN